MARLKGLTSVAWIGAGAALLWLVIRVGFPNYDTLYALVWGQQIDRGQTPTYHLPYAPTPHPLAELFGAILAPLGAATTETVVVVLAYLALSALGYVVYLLGREWFSWPVGLAAAALLLTREPILNYGVRAYVDVPYLVLVLAALLVETRRRFAGWPVLALLGFAGLLRPEAWLFAAIYWIYLARRSGRPRPALGALAVLVAIPPLLWGASDLAITGNAIWSFTQTHSTAHTLHRTTGLANVPITGSRRIGEILRPDVLIAAAIGGALALWLLRARVLLASIAGVIGVVALAIVAAGGLPINTRYVFLPAAILTIFAGAGLFGWRSLPAGHPQRRLWQLAMAIIVVAVVATTPSQVSRLRSTFASLRAQQRIASELVALTADHAITARCEPVGVPYHAPIPLLALRLHIDPRDVPAAPITRGTFVTASATVLTRYLLDKRDPPVYVRVPAGFPLSAANETWRVYRRCR